MTVLSPRGLGAQLDRYVASTPPERDRFVDLLRVFAIGVVIVWHRALSITRWHDGVLSMPDPIDVVPGARIATWALQVVPLFSRVCGFANYAGWDSARRDGGGLRAFYGARLRRLLLPTAIFVAVWPAIDGILLVPLTARLHAAGGVLTVTAMGSVIALVDLGRFRFGIEELGFLNSALVWVFVHQLGYFYRDGTFGRIGRRGQLALSLAALTGMIVFTSLPVYAVSMVATPDVGFSHMWPTTAMTGIVGLLESGLAMLLRPRLQPWSRRRRVRKAVIAINAVMLTIFVWHMTAKVTVIGAYMALGFELVGEPTLTWWAQRPLWLLGPGVVLAVVAALFGPFELRLRRD